MKRYSKKKNSTKILYAVAVIGALVFTISNYFVAHKDDVVIAKINNTKILKDDVERKLREVFEGQSQEVKIPEVDRLPKEVLEILIKEIYLEKELTADAKKSKATKTKEVEDKIVDVKNKILRQVYIDSLLKEEVTDEKINTKFSQLNKEIEGKKEYLTAHIVVKTKADAEKIEKELKKPKPAKFADLAKKYSIDPDSANNGGELGYVLQSNMLKEISDIVIKLSKDQISSPVETKFGWHLIKVLDVRDAQTLPFEAVKENIRDQLIQDKVNEINSSITKNAKIEILIELKEPEKKPEEKPVQESETKPEIELGSTANKEQTSTETSDAAVAEKASENVTEEKTKTDQADAKESNEQTKDKKHKRKSR